MIFLQKGQQGAGGNQLKPGLTDEKRPAKGQQGCLPENGVIGNHVPEDYPRKSWVLGPPHREQRAVNELRLSRIKTSIDKLDPSGVVFSSQAKIMQNPSGERACQ